MEGFSTTKIEPNVPCAFFAEMLFYCIPFKEVLAGSIRPACTQKKGLFYLNNQTNIL